MNRSTVSPETARKRVDFLVRLTIFAIPLLHYLTDLTRGLEYLFHHYLADDAFYYFEIAKHIPEFNLGIATSGFHPLYAFLISWFQVNLPYQSAIPLSLLVLVVLHTLSGLILWHLLSRNWPREVVLITVLLWLTSPMLYRIALSGLETALSATLLLLFFAAIGRGLEPEQGEVRQAHLGTATVMVVGSLAGISFMARMDSPLILLPAIVLLALRLLKKGELKKFLLFAASISVLPVAWLSFTYSRTGNIFPTSGAALRVLRGIDGQLISPATMMIRSLLQLMNALVDFFVLLPRSMEYVVLAVLAPAAIVAVTSYLLRPNGPRERALAGQAAVVLSGTFLWAMYYIVYQGGFRRWYFAQMAPAIFLILVPMVLSKLAFSLAGSKHLQHSFKNISRGPWMMPALALIMASCSLGVSPLAAQPFAPQAYDKYKAALAADSIFEAGNAIGRIGAFNTGIYNYFMDADVVNLDGVVNPGAMKAIRDGRLDEYLAVMNIRFLIEHDIGEASNLARLHEYEEMKIQKWVDLTQLYAGWNGKYAKRTFLWTITFSEK